MTPSQKYLKKLGLKDQDTIEEVNENRTEETRENERRYFFKK
jgi:hypothetical protein